MSGTFAAWFLLMSETWYDLGNYGDGLGRMSGEEAEWLAGKIRERVDYEAALRLHHESVRPLISGAQCDREMRAVKMLVDAALGIEEDS